MKIAIDIPDEEFATSLAHIVNVTLAFENGKLVPEDSEYPVEVIPDIDEASMTIEEAITLLRLGPGDYDVTEKYAEAADIAIKTMEACNGQRNDN